MLGLSKKARGAFSSPGRAAGPAIIKKPNEHMSSQLAVQTFTIRQFTKSASGLAEALKKIRKIGYEAVQLSCVEAMNGENPQVSAKEVRRMLDDEGLKCIATHRAWDALIHRTNEEVDFHNTLGCDYVAIGGIRVETHDAASYQAFAQEAVQLAKQLQAHGIRFGYHNHSYEFFRPERHGSTLYDILIDETGPHLHLELDLYWAEYAGLNCTRILDRCHGRVPVIHLKDKEAIQGEYGVRMAPIGEGNMDWAEILPACKRAGVEWYVVEQDECHRDPFDCLKSSFDYLSSFSL